MDTWTSQMSFPLVSVTRNYVNGLAFVAQVRVFDDGDLFWGWRAIL